MRKAIVRQAIWDHRASKAFTALHDTRRSLRQGPAGHTWLVHLTWVLDAVERLRAPRPPLLMPLFDVGDDPTGVPLVSNVFSREWAPRQAYDPCQELPLRLTLHAASLDTYPLDAIDTLRDLDKVKAVDVLISRGAGWLDTTNAAPATITVDARALVPKGGPVRPRW